MITFCFSCKEPIEVGVEYESTPMFCFMCSDVNAVGSESEKPQVL